MDCMECMTLSAEVVRSRLVGHHRVSEPGSREHACAEHGLRAERREKEEDLISPVHLSEKYTTMDGNVRTV